MSAEVWKQSEVAAAFLQERANAIPDRSRQIDVMLRLLKGTRLQRVLDLGAGDALLLNAVLQAFPEASGVALDFSPPMLEQARVRLQPFGSRAVVIEGDFATPAWLQVVAGPFDAVISGFAIHHLAHERKRALYAEVFGLLAAGGTFVNCEHVASPSPRVERLFDEAMSEHLCAWRRERGEAVSVAQVFQEYVTRPDRAANILAPVEVQCRWLREIGFRDVDCYWKFFELAVFGGVRA